MALKNNFDIGTLDTLIAFYDRDKNHGTIDAVETVTAQTLVRAAIKQNERWKATDNKDDINKFLVIEMRYYASINAEHTVIVYQGTHYKVRDIEIIGRRQFLKITAQRDQA